HIDELEISTATPEEIKETIQKNDGIYISGGNTFFLLQELQNSGADKIIIDEVFNGKIYIGESAGSMIAGKNIEYAKKMDDASVAKNLISQEALGLVDFALVPHFGNFPFEEATKNIIEKYSGILDLKPISNSEAIFIQDDNINILKK
ncbi:peptidase, partial [Candidatus Gracilibacteria bacterium]